MAEKCFPEVAEGIKVQQDHCLPQIARSESVVKREDKLKSNSFVRMKNYPAEFERTTTDLVHQYCTN